VTELASTIKASLEHDEWTPDWGDVLSRARTRPSRFRRGAAVGTVSAVALVLTLPGIGIGGRLKDLIAGSRGPGIHLRAGLSLPGGRSVGTLTLRTSRIFVTVPSPKGRDGRVEPRPFFIPRGHRSALPPVQIRWSLDLSSGVSVRSAWIEGRQGNVIARLCAPCSDGAHGTIDVRARALSAIFGRATAVTDTSQGHARGTVRLETPLH
jgi:hypothetical protein